MITWQLFRKSDNTSIYLLTLRLICLIMSSNSYFINLHSNPFNSLRLLSLKSTQIYLIITILVAINSIEGRKHHLVLNVIIESITSMTCLSYNECLVSNRMMSAGISQYRHLASSLVVRCPSKSNSSVPTPSKMTQRYVNGLKY